MKKRILALVAAAPLIFGGVSFATQGYHHHKPKDCESSYEQKCEQPVDVCSNIEGVQTTVPKGKELKDGLCVDIVVTPSQPPVETPAPPTPEVTAPTAPVTPVVVNGEEFTGK